MGRSCSAGSVLARKVDVVVVVASERRCRCRIFGGLMDGREQCSAASGIEIRWSSVAALAAMEDLQRKKELRLLAVAAVVVLAGLAAVVEALVDQA